VVRRRRGAAAANAAGHGFLRGLRLVRDEVPSFERYPFAIAAVRHLDELELDPKVTFFVGENGSGKSTLLEAIAISVGFNAEGGSKNFAFSTRSSESDLSKYLRVARSARRERDGFFLRAEALFNAATYIEQVGVQYGDKSLHEQSHGESFLALAQHRFGSAGLYLLDEPEAALSPARQLSLLKIMHHLIERTGSQFIIATHSPILLAYPGARLYSFGSEGIAPIAYEETEHYRVTRDFLAAPERYFKHLFEEEEATGTEEPKDD
jgi:predicted ATPase